MFLTYDIHNAVRRVFRPIGQVLTITELCKPRSQPEESKDPAKSEFLKKAAASCLPRS